MMLDVAILGAGEGQAAAHTAEIGAAPRARALPRR